MVETKAFIFDIGGVCIENIWSDPVKVRKFAELVGVDNREIKGARDRYWGSFKRGEISERRFWTGILSTLEIPMKEDLISRMSELFRSSNVPINETLEIARELKESYRVVALNDESREFNEYRRQKFGLDDIFEFFVTSCEVGVAKPNRKIYEITLDRLGERANACVFIDDSQKNLIPGRELGMKTIHYQSPQQLRGDLVKIGVSAR